MWLMTICAASRFQGGKKMKNRKKITAMLIAAVLMMLQIVPASAEEQGSTSELCGTSEITSVSGANKISEIEKIDSIEIPQETEHRGIGDSSKYCIELEEPAKSEDETSPLPEENGQEAVDEAENYEAASSLKTQQEIFQKLEALTRQALLDGKTSVDISGLNISVSKFPHTSNFWKYSPYFGNGIQPWVYYSGDKFVSIEIENYLDLSTTREYIEAVDDVVKTVCSSVRPEMTTLEKCMTIHDYIDNVCNYDYTFNSDTIYTSAGVLINGSAVCDGYSHAFLYIMTRLGVECYVPASDSMDHAWNIVKVDGNYYHIDCTWDDWDNLGMMDHNYFLLSDDAIRNAEHYGWDLTNYVCNNTQYDNAFWRGATSAVIFAEDAQYYVKQNSSTWYYELICRYGGVEYPVLELPYWPIWDSDDRNYNNYTGLVQHDGWLYYNTADEIIRLEMNTGYGEVILDRKKMAADGKEGFFCGIMDVGGRLVFAFSKDPDYNYDLFAADYPETPEHVYDSSEVDFVNTLINDYGLKWNVNDPDSWPTKNAGSGYVKWEGDFIRHMTSLYIGGALSGNHTTMTVPGLEYLTLLDCSNNKLTRFDLSEASDKIRVVAEGSPVEYLVVPGGKNLSFKSSERGQILLKEINVPNNQVTILAKGQPGYAFSQWKTTPASLMDTAIVKGNELTIPMQYDGAVITASYKAIGYVKGDLTGDGSVRVDDLRIVLRAVCNKITLNDVEKKCADVNENGRIDVEDLRLILRYICNKISSL